MIEFIVPEKPVVEIIGPFRGDVFRLIVNGCKVPFVWLYRRDDTEFDWCLVVDDRFEADVNEDEIMRWGYVFAQAMAVSAGYTSHGPNSLPLNRFSVQVNELSNEQDLEAATS